MRMITRRIAFYLVTAVVAITVNFFIPRLMPGNPALAVLGRVQAEESKQAIAALELQYGVSTKTGLWGQYVQYWSHLLHGNLGTSLNFYPASVGGLIRAALPWTVALIGVATLISFLLGTLLGVAAAWRRGSWLDGLLPAMTFFQAAPYFFVAILAVALFATKLGWFPPNSGYDTTTLNPGFNWPFISNMIDHAVLPAVTIVLASIAGWIIGMRNMMITTMDEDYVLLAQAKGLPSRRGARVAGGGGGGPRGTRCCPAWPPSPWPSGSSSRARCSPRSSSPIRAWGTCCSPRSAATTTR